MRASQVYPGAGRAIRCNRLFRYRLFRSVGCFLVVPTLTQWALERAGLLDAAMASTSNLVGGVIFVAAGSYQWTRLKGICLAQCQMPFAFLIRHGGFRRDAPGALMLGLRYGARIASAAAGC